MPGTGLIILAAGGSSRFGSPKQLLCRGGKTLIQRAVDIALNSVCKPLIVVLGASAELIRPELEDRPVHCVVNPGWQSGMGSSIVAGIEALLLSSSDVESVCIMLCDQPFLTSGVINQLIQTHRNSGAKIVASDYGEGPRVPALFHRTLFDELQSLSCEEGAKHILQRYKHEISVVPFPLGLMDVDTPEDWKNIRTIPVCEI